MKMKKNVAMLALGFIASFALGCVTLNANTVSADEANADKFEMEFGVQLALKKDAMRWIVGMGKNVYDEIVTNDADEKVSLSVVVSSKLQFDAMVDGNYIDIEKKTLINIPDEKIYKSGDYYYANAALTGIFETEQNDKELVAVGVIVTENEGVSTYEYADFNGNDINNNVRAQYDVLQQVALDTREEAQEWVDVVLGEDSPYKAWFGTEEFPLVVDTAEKYDSLVAQINKGANIAMNVELDTSVITNSSAQLEEGKQLPAATTKYHTVNFYNGDELLETVTNIADGASVAYDGEIKSYAVNLLYSGGNIGGERFDKWVTENGGTVEADLSNVNKSMNVYVKTSYGDVTNDLMSYAKEEEPNTALYFDREVGFTQISNRNGSATTLSSANRLYDTSVKFMDEKGSTKISYKGLSLSKDAYVNLAAVNATTEAGKYVVLHVYVDGSDGLTEVWFRMNGGKGDRVFKGKWGTLVYEAKDFASNPYFMMSIRGSGTEQDVDIYFGKAEIVSGQDLLNSTDTFNIGNTEFSGVWMRNYYTAAASKAHLFTPNDGIFLRDLNVHPHGIDNKLYYHETISSGSESGAVCLTFKNSYAYNTSKIYITASGMSAPSMQLFRAKESGHDGLGAAKATSQRDLGNGFIEYCFDLSSRNTSLETFGYFRLFTGNGASPTFAQIVISDITVVTE